jgi:hypothetical protein
MPVRSKPMNASHENFHRPDALRRSSNRTFGFVFAAFFAVVALLPLLRHHSARTWAAGLSGIFLLVALLAPRVLAAIAAAPRGESAGPGSLFHFVFTLLSSLLRLLGNDFLRLGAAPGAASYWMSRQPPVPEPASMANQF